MPRLKHEGAADAVIQQYSGAGDHHGASEREGVAVDEGAAVAVAIPRDERRRVAFILGPAASPDACSRSIRFRASAAYALETNLDTSKSVTSGSPA
jgi:hypothetical protein